MLDEVIAVDDEDAIETARLLARREGVLAGISCGAALWAAIEVAERPESRGEADRRDPARLGRALRLDAVLRAVARATAERGSPAAPSTLERMLGLGTFAASLGEIRRDVRAAQERDPAARGVGSQRDPRDLAGRARRARAPRRARAARGGRAVAAAR